MIFHLIQKVFGFCLMAGFHVAALTLLLRDGVAVPVDQIGHSVVLKLIEGKNYTPENTALAPLDIKAPPFTIEPPQLNLPLGKSEPLQPMVIIGAKFSPEVALTIPAAQYAAGLQIVNLYCAQVGIQIFEDGSVGDVHIEASDGNAVLDQFITAYARKHWHFEPALSDGVPSLSWKTVNVEVSAKELIVRR